MLQEKRIRSLYWGPGPIIFRLKLILYRPDEKIKLVQVLIAPHFLVVRDFRTTIVQHTDHVRQFVFTNAQEVSDFIAGTAPFGFDKLVQAQNHVKVVILGGKYHGVNISATGRRRTVFCIAREMLNRQWVKDGSLVILQSVTPGDQLKYTNPCFLSYKTYNF